MIRHGFWGVLGILEIFHLQVKVFGLHTQSWGASQPLGQFAQANRSTANSTSTIQYFSTSDESIEAGKQIGVLQTKQSVIADPTLINIVLAGDRLPAIHAVLTSISLLPTSYLVYVWMLSSSLQNVDEAFTLAGDRFAGFSVISLKDVEDDLLEQGITPIWLWHVYGTTAAHNWKRQGTIDLEKWDGASKHLSPFNHVRFYLAHLRWFRDLDRLIMLDDDVIVMKDLLRLLKMKMEPKAALASTCESWRWNNDMQAFRYFPGNARLSNSATLYMNTHAYREKAMATFVPFIQAINHLGPGILHKESDWNFGISLLNIQRWHHNNITQQYTAWMRTNYDEHLIQERSLVFGLGLPQLALLTHHQCFSTSKFHIAEGLGFIKSSDLHHNELSLGKYLKNAFALHYCGTKKPWDSLNNLESDFRRPYLDMVSQSAYPIDDVALSNLSISDIKNFLTSSLTAIKKRKKRRVRLKLARRHRTSRGDSHDAKNSLIAF